MENFEKTLSLYGSHDASATFVDKNKKIRVLEYERFVKQRYAMYSDRFDHRKGIGTNQESREKFINYIISTISNKDIETILYNELSETDIKYISSKFPLAKFKRVGHHTAHASSGYYTSKFDDALIISIDGGGNDITEVVTSKTYLGENNNVTPLKSYSLDLGNPYSKTGYAISEIKPGIDSKMTSLSYAGKVMGICAYGQIRNDWLDSFREYYTNANLESLFSKIKLPYGFDSLSGKNSYDLAATSQFVFEELFLKTFWDIIVHHNKNVILVGGCALNVLLNQRLKEMLEKINLKLYVPSNPNDCGLSLGQFLYHHKLRINENIVYSGFDILDIDNLESYIKDYNAEKCSVDKIVSLLSSGKIIGIINDGSEIGPRALGNRSIICDPTYKDMKDILNKKVKFREWFRPFAPVCKLEDKDLFFDKAYESKFMSYAPNVKSEYKEKLISITHQDGTARLQTVTENDHKFFYKILTVMSQRSLVPVILNTSFNIRGLPILTTIEDALYVLNNTELDYVYTNGYLFKKK